MTEIATTQSPRCGHPTSTGPCARPEGHSNNGHKSAKNLQSRGTKSLSPEEMKQREAERHQRALKAIKDQQAAQAKAYERLVAMADAMGYALVPKAAEATADAE